MPHLSTPRIARVGVHRPGGPFARLVIAATLAAVVGCSDDPAQDPTGAGGTPLGGGAGETGGGPTSGGSTLGGSTGDPAGGAGSPTGGAGSPTGGAGSPTGGTGSPTGGTGNPTGGTGGTPGDAEAAAHLSTCIDSLPWGQNNIHDRARLIDVIIATCREFAPPGAEWQRDCELFLIAAINKESSFNASSVVEDSYGGATDPTVGLTQIRFSSTVRDYHAGGPLDALERIGCDFPATLSGEDAHPYLDMMMDPACNIALGAWYYFVYATGNGGDQVVYHYQYCQGRGVAANLTIGMLSHLRGPAGALGGGSDPYVVQIQEWFDHPACNGPSAGTHPFLLTLPPEPAKYCR